MPWGDVARTLRKKWYKGSGDTCEVGNDNLTWFESILKQNLSPMLRSKM